jgi:hypothetical protein
VNTVAATYNHSGPCRISSSCVKIAVSATGLSKDDDSNGTRFRKNLPALSYVQVRLISILIKSTQSEDKYGWFLCLQDGSSLRISWLASVLATDSVSVLDSCGALKGKCRNSYQDAAKNFSSAPQWFTVVENNRPDRYLILVYSITDTLGARAELNLSC